MQLLHTPLIKNTRSRQIHNANVKAAITKIPKYLIKQVQIPSHIYNCAIRDFLFMHLAPKYSPERLISCYCHL